MSNSSFFKFPSTHHLVFSSENEYRSDKLISDEEKRILLSSEVTIEEKIDGSNLGISFDKNGQIHLQNRGSYLYPPYRGQWEKMLVWLDLYCDKLFDILEDKYVLFGEWCYAKHSIYYSSLPNWFIAFDVYDICERKFFSVKRRNEIIKGAGLPIVPFIKYGRFQEADIPGLIQKSAYGDSLCEGLYFRHDMGDWLNIRAKYVRKTFSQSIVEHWGSVPLQKNEIAAFSVQSQQFID